MTTAQKFEITRMYENMYKKYNLKELKESLDFFLKRGCNANNNNKQEYNIHLQVLKSEIFYKK